jgi:hypothetical protein
MNPAEMLALVAIGYRGCELNLSLPRSRKRVADEITQCLDSFGPLKAAEDGRYYGGRLVIAPVSPVLTLPLCTSPEARGRL